MKMVRVLLIVAIIATLHPTLLVSSECKDDDYLELIVKASGSDNLYVADFSTRFIYHNGDVKEIDAENISGSIRIDKSALLDVEFIVICHKYFYCGAIDVKESKLDRFDAYSIDLAPFHT